MSKHLDSEPLSGRRAAADAFNRDATANLGYRYTTGAGLSSALANRRLSDAALELLDFRGRRVVDVGCGDGAYTMELFDRGGPATMHGIDPAGEAIRVARGRAPQAPVTFAIGSADALPYSKDQFDVAHLRGVLHHMDTPVEALREALRVAPALIVIEPNGYNPGLKLLERFSRYHIEHGEKSYAPAALDRWVTQVGGRVQSRAYAGVVPFFCPDWMARLLKLVEPVVERLPIIRSLVCAVYVLSVARESPDVAPRNRELAQPA
jgi:SAM-dependent methyltransferase